MKEQKGKVLIIDDTLKNIQVLGTILRRENYQIYVAQNGTQAIETAQKVLPDLIISDVMMPDIDGFEVCKRLKQNVKTKNIPVIFLTAKTETEDVIQGFQIGAVDYITKPVNTAEVLVRVNSHITPRKLHKEVAHKSQLLDDFTKKACSEVEHVLLGKSVAVQELNNAISEYTVNHENVVLVGPFGCGAEGVARAIHYGSERRDKPFIHINCSRATSENVTFDLKMEEIITEKTSKLELANAGTIFLENIYDLTPGLKLELRRSLEILRQQKEVGDKLAVDVRIIAYAPNQNLNEDSRSSSFNVLRLVGKNLLSIPSLAERSEDIEILSLYFLQKLGKSLGKSFQKISDDSVKNLNQYTWPGNICELHNVIERAIILGNTDVLEVDAKLLD